MQILFKKKKKNTENIKKCEEFLNVSMIEIHELIVKCVQKFPINYNIKQEAIYKIPNTDTVKN